LADTDRRIQYVNRRFEELTGYSADEAREMDTTRLGDQDAAEQDRMRAQLASGQDWFGEFHNRRKSGEHYWTLASIAPLRSAEGKITHYLAVQEDITARKEAERKLRESEERFRTLMAKIPDGVGVSIHGRAVYGNSALAAMLGYREEDLVDSEIANFLHPDDRERAAGRIKALYAKGEEFASEYRMLRADGSVVPVEISSRIIQFDGKPALLSVFHDLSERKRAARALQESDERLGQLAQSIQGVFFMWDAETLELLYVSPAYESIWGRSLRSLYEKNDSWQDIIHPDDRERVGAWVNARSKAALNMEYRIVRDDGSVRWIWSRAYPIYNEQGVLYRVGGIAEDITDRKQAELAMLQSQKLESVGRLAGGLAHEFNNLLVTILGQTSLAKEKLPPKGAAIAYLNRALSAGERGADLMRQLLAYSGRGQFEVKSLHLNNLIQDNQHLYKLAIRKNMQLEFDFASNLPPIRGDAGQIQQAVMNLVLNAADAIGDEPGVVTITTGMHSVKGDETELWQYTGIRLQPGDYVMLEVRDDGMGIPQEALPRLFEPFFSTKSKRPGLGLAAVLGIVSSLKGGLQVNSELQKGSTFRLLFPVDASDAAQASDSAHLLRRDMILVIDDDQDVCDTVSVILTSAGLRVIYALEGNAGIQLYQKHAVEIGLVLLDWSMPGLSGEVTFHELRAINPNLRVILSSGYTESEATRRLLGKGLTGFVQKPYQAEQLVAEIRRFLETK
jgi:PAS domain S-box-containing protein